MKFDQNYLEGFVKSCMDQDLDENEMTDAYLVHCGEVAMNDPAFRSGFEACLKKGASSLDNIEKTEVHRIIGEALVSGILEEDTK